MGLVAGFARCLVDRREPGKIRHTLAGVASDSGSSALPAVIPMANDANHLADDPIHKLLLGRDPVAGEALASQPTISRFENGVGRSALYELGRELAMRSSSGISTGWTGRRGGSRSTWIRPTTRRTAPSSSPSSTGTTTAGATLPLLRF